MTFIDPSLCHSKETATLQQRPILEMRSEHEAQRHLDLSRASDRFVGDSQSALVGTDIKRSAGRTLVETGVTRTLCRRQAGNRKALKADVLADVVDGNIEARRVGQVEDIETST